VIPPIISVFPLWLTLTQKVIFIKSLIKLSRTDNLYKSIFFFATLFLLLFVGNIYATNYYVSIASSGNASANNWTNKKIITSFNWSQVQGGDTVYIDGGTDSLTYKMVKLESITPTGIVIITKGKDSGHNGKVIFSPSVSNSSNYCAFRVKGSTNIKLTGLTFKWELTSAGNGEVLLISDYSDNTYVDNCHIISNGYGGVGVMVTNSDHVSLTNNIIESLANNVTTQQDCIDFVTDGGGHTITGNTIIARGTNNTPHIDIIQFMINSGLTNYYLTTIANNFMFAAKSSGPGNNQGIYIDAVRSHRFLIYNNIIVTETPINTAVTIKQTSPYHVSAQIYNNTIISKSHYTLETVNLDTLIFKNNICVIDSGSSSISVIGLGTSGLGLSGLGYKSFDYNQYFQRGNPIRIDTGAFYHTTWAQWKVLGYDAHSDTGIVNFVNIWGTNATDYKLKSSTTPVELTSFSGVFINNSVRLTWSTATEINNQGFDIERNTNSSWVKIGFIEGKGNSVIKNDYSFEDKTPVGSTIQYRLKQIDYNGNFNYYDAISVTAIPQDFSIGNYPNPFNPSTKIRYSIPSESMINLVIYNLIGERIDELKNELQQPGTFETNWNGSGHPSGIYFLSIIESPVNGSAKNSKTIKMNLIK
jgi:hypothetical protein